MIKLTDHFWPTQCEAIKNAFGAEYVEQLIDTPDHEIRRNCRNVGAKFLARLRDLQVKGAEELETAYKLKRAYNNPLGSYRTGIEGTAEEWAHRIGHGLTAQDFVTIIDQGSLTYWFQAIRRPKKVVNNSTKLST